MAGGGMGRNSLTSRRARRRFAVAAEASGAAVPLAATFMPPSWEQRRDHMIFPAARIVSPTGTVGSGFVIASTPASNATYVITNHHVIQGAIQQVDRWDPVDKSSKKVERLQTVSVETFRYDGRGRHLQTVKTSAEVVAYSQYGDQWSFEGDLALLRLLVPLQDKSVARLITEDNFLSDVHLLDDVVMVGCPDGNEIPLPTTGHVASMTEERAGVGLLLSQVFGNPGSSGSAVYRYSHERGAYEVIAVHSMVDFRGSLTDKGQGSFLRLAVPAPVIHTFLQRHGFEGLVAPPALPKEEDAGEENTTAGEETATVGEVNATATDAGDGAGNATAAAAGGDEGDGNSSTPSSILPPPPPGA